MNDIVPFVAYIFSSMGITVLIVWPKDGPGAWLRDQWLRRTLPKFAQGVLDCYVCLGVWSGFACSFPCWWIYRQAWCWTGCLIVPFLFWWIVADRS